MSKYFEVDFRTGSFQDRTGKVSYLTSGNPTIINGDKGLYLNGSNSIYPYYTSRIFPDNAFTVVCFVKNKRLTTNQAIISGNYPSINIYSDTNRILLYLSSDTFRYFNTTIDEKWHCYIFTIPSNVAADIANSCAYRDGIQLTADAINIGSTPVRTNINLRLTSNIAYLATYDHVFTEAERIQAQRDFENSYPMISPEVIDFPKPMDLSREVNNTLGSELITNGGFNTDTSWTKGTNWTIVNGKATSTGSNQWQSVSQNITTVVGKKYRVTFDVEYISGSLLIRMGGGTNLANINSGGVKVLDIIAEGAGISFMSNATGFEFVGSIDNISVKELTGLVAAYNMIPQGNTLVDISGNGRSATLTGGIVSSKKGIKFFGSLNNQRSFTYTGISLSVWTYNVRIYHTSTYGYSLTCPSTNPCIIHWEAAGGLGTYIGGGYLWCGHTLSQNQWYTISAVSNGTTVSFYVNGMYVGLTTPTTTTITFSGFGSFANNNFSGELEDYRVYNRILSLTEIKAYHNSFVTPTLVEDFSSEGADDIAKVPTGWSKISGSFKVGEWTKKTGNLVTNGTFDSATGWTINGTGVSISGGVAIFNNSGAASNFQIAGFPSTVGKSFLIKYEIKTISAGSLQISFGGRYTPLRSTVGVYSEIVHGSIQDGTFWIFCANGTTATIDNVSVVEIPPLPTFKPGTKYLECVTPGVIAMPSKQAYGTWELDWYYTSSSTLPLFQYISSKRELYNQTGSGWMFYCNAVGNISINKFINNSWSGGLTTNAILSSNTWYRFKITRNTSGTTTLYVKGGTFGNTEWVLVTSLSSGTNPFTDNDYNISEYTVFRLYQYDRIANIKLTDGIII